MDSEYCPEKQSLCIYRAFSSFPLLYLIILCSELGEFQWIPLTAEDRGIQFGSLKLLEARSSFSNTIFLFSMSLWSLHKGHSKGSDHLLPRGAIGRQRLHGFLIPSTPSQIWRLHSVLGYKGPNVILLCLLLRSPRQKHAEGCPRPHILTVFTTAE